MASKGRPTHKELSSKEPSREERQELADYLTVGDDLVAAVVAQSLIEYQLETLLRKEFKRSSNDDWKRMTGDHGPANTFAQKIELGYAFGLYDDTFRKNLKLIKEIRNQFAHSKFVLKFSNPLIIDALAKIQTSRFFTKIETAAMKSAAEKNNPKDIFVVWTFIICIKLMKIKTKQENISTALKQRHYQKRLAKLILEYRSVPGYQGGLGLLSQAHQIGGPSLLKPKP